MEIFYAILGLIIGSFLNCVVYRLSVKENFLISRSYCPNCKHVLAWYDLIPVLSFIILKAKCRYCGKKISFEYPIVEIITALVFLFIQNNPYLLIVSCFLIVIFIYDLKYFIIPDIVLFPLIAVVLIYRIIFYQDLLNAVISAFLASIFFLLIILFTRGKGMGIGDLKFAFFMGLFLGYPNILLALFLSFAIGAIIGIGLILAKRKSLKSEVPFGPFLIIGTFIAFFWGEMIINWYLGLFL